MHSSHFFLHLLSRTRMRISCVKGLMRCWESMHTNFTSRRKAVPANACAVITLHYDNSFPACHCSTGTCGRSLSGRGHRAGSGRGAPPPPPPRASSKPLLPPCSTLASSLCSAACTCISAWQFARRGWLQGFASDVHAAAFLALPGQCPVCELKLSTATLEAGKPVGIGICNKVCRIEA